MPARRLRDRPSSPQPSVAGASLFAFAISLAAWGCGRVHLGGGKHANTPQAPQGPAQPVGNSVDRPTEAVPLFTVDLDQSDPNKKKPAPSSTTKGKPKP